MDISNVDNEWVYHNLNTYRLDILPLFKHIPLLCNLNLNHVMFKCDKYN